MPKVVNQYNAPVGMLVDSPLRTSDDSAVTPPSFDDAPDALLVQEMERPAEMVPVKSSASPADQAIAYASLPPAALKDAEADTNADECSTPHRNTQQERWRYDDRVHPDLRDANLESADFRNANLCGANLEGAVLKSTNLEGANLRNAKLRRTEMRTSSFYHADLRGADLRDARLSCSGSDCRSVTLLAEANLSSADLRGAHFGISLIGDSLFDGADLRGANLAEASGKPKSMRGALYDRHTRLPKRIIDPEKWHMIYVPDSDSATLANQ